MPLAEIGQEDQEDLYPKDADAHRKLLSFCTDAFTAAEDARRPHEERWYRYYQLKRSYVKPQQGDWRSRRFIPLTFLTIQTILPRLVAALPKGVVYPVGPEDEAGAPGMEQLLEWAGDQSDLYLELVEVYDSALTYGTGILKTRPMRNAHKRRRRQPKMEQVTAMQQEPVMDPATGAPMKDLNGSEMFEDREVVVGERETEEQETIEEEVVSYVGPVAEAIDIFNLFPAPEADGVPGSRYIIHRRFADKDEVDELVRKGVYRMPDHISPAELWTNEDDPQWRRASEVGLGGGRNTDATRKTAEIWEIWRRNQQVITVLNQRAIVRVTSWPFEHGQMPFVRIVDYLNPHEFWGSGEIEHIEGLQALENAIWNTRVDNVRLLINAMFAYDATAISDPRALRMRPGGGIPVNNVNGLPLDQVIQRIDLGDVTASAYEEAAEVERMIEKVTGVTAQQIGIDSPMYNDTATGAAILSEQGNSRFSFKVRLAELTGLRALFRQYGALIQEFTPPELPMRLIGPDGAVAFEQIPVESLMGAFDYDIESESSTQTETIRKDQSLSLLNTLANLTTVDPLTGMARPVIDVEALAQDVLRAFGKKDIDRYMLPEPGPSPEEMAAGAPMGPELPPELAGLAPEAVMQ